MEHGITLAQSFIRFSALISFGFSKLCRLQNLCWRSDGVSGAIYVF